MKNLFLMFFVILLLWIFAPTAGAIYNPLDVPNNRVGVHILETSEVDQAAKLVNTNGGDWGYVTIPIRSNDRDTDKWRTFFDNCRKYHLIPILRIATYPTDGVWAVPNVYDLVDFANFLTDMPWPIKNRYIILFNEVNHAAEWGGRVSPLEYATLLLDARQIFKARNPDFFLISAGLDMSAPSNKTSLDALEFLRQISQLQPKWYEAVDGLSVHAYPNPAFSSSAFSKTRYGIASYKYELDVLKKLGYAPKPLFITETGWTNSVGEFTTAFEQIWTDNTIVAITPFVLYSASGDFAKFSLFEPNYHPKPKYRAIQNLAKIAGSPLLSDIALTSAPTTVSASYFNNFLPSKSSTISSFVTLWKKLLGLTHLRVGNVEVWVELATTDKQRQKGLSKRTSLSSDSGMLFVFDVPGSHTFWMNEMLIALDFVWIRNGKVVRIDKNVLPPSQTNNQPLVINPETEIDQVLEVPAGWVDKHAIILGDEVTRL